MCIRDSGYGDVAEFQRFRVQYLFHGRFEKLHSQYYYENGKDVYKRQPCYWIIEKMKCPLWFILVCFMYATIPDRR